MSDGILLLIFGYCESLFILEVVYSVIVKFGSVLSIFF